MFKVLLINYLINDVMFDGFSDYICYKSVFNFNIFLFHDDDDDEKD